MADNYLERRMEDYRNGKLSSKHMSPAVVKRPSMQLRVFVIGGDTELGITYVKNFRKSNWKVAFTDADLKSGRSLAQSTGAQHHPIAADNLLAIEASVQKIVELWGAIDLVVNCAEILPEEIVKSPMLLAVPIINAR